MKPTLTFLCVIHCLIPHFPLAQNLNAIDSLKDIVASGRGADHFLPLYDLAFEYLDYDNVKALEFISRAEKAALLSGDSLWIVKSKRVKGQILYKLERLSDALVNFREALAIAEGNEYYQECTMIANTSGSVYLFIGQIDMALKYYFRTLEFATKNGDTEYEVMSLNNIGLAYYTLLDYRKALNYFHRSEQLHNEINKDPYYVLINISLCYSMLSEFSRAHRYIDSARTNCAAHCTDAKIMRIWFASGILLDKEKKYRKATEAFLASLYLSEKVGDSRVFLENVYMLSGIYLRRGDLLKAKAILFRGRERIEKGVPFSEAVMVTYQRCADFYFKTGQFREAADYQRRYINLKDSIYGRKLTSRLMNIEAEVLEKDNQAKIKAQRDIILINERMIRRQRVINIVTGLLVLVTTLFLVSTFRNYRRKKNSNALLEKRVQERTAELEINRQILMISLREKDLRLDKAVSGMSEMVRTVSGLCASWKLESGNSCNDSYIAKFEDSASRLEMHKRSVIKY